MPSPSTFPAFLVPLLPGESREELEALLDAYYAEYDPQTITEERCIAEMTNADWRIRRLRNLEASAAQGPNEASLKHQTQSRLQEAHLKRIYDEALRLLLELRARHEPSSKTERVIHNAALLRKESPNVPLNVQATKVTNGLHS